LGDESEARPDEEAGRYSQAGEIKNTTGNREEKPT
jgi:hypothetical protein